jgi:hypothetical protein
VHGGWLYHESDVDINSQQGKSALNVAGEDWFHWGLPEVQDQFRQKESQGIVGRTLIKEMKSS